MITPVVSKVAKIHGCFNSRDSKDWNHFKGHFTAIKQAGKIESIEDCELSPKINGTLGNNAFIDGNIVLFMVSPNFINDKHSANVMKQTIPSQTKRRPIIPIYLNFIYCDDLEPITLVKMTPRRAC